MPALLAEERQELMDWSSTIPALIGAIASAGGVGGIFHIRETRRAKRLENDRTAANEWKELYERSEQKCESLGVKLDELYITLRKEQEDKNALRVQLERMKLLHCDKTPCMDRHPPFGQSAAINP